MNKVLAKSAGLVIGVIALAMPVLTSAAASGGAGLGPQTAGTYQNGGCLVHVQKAKNDAFNVSGNTASAPVKITGPKSCKATLSVASWNAPAGASGFGPLADQKLVSARTVVRGPGSYDIWVTINPTCNFQTDLVNGSNPLSVHGDANYGNNSKLIGYLQVRNGICPLPAQPPATPAPTPAPAPSVTDLCPNIEGMQTAIPQGDVLDASGNCVPTPAPSVAIAACDSQNQTALADNSRTVTVNGNNNVTATSSGCSETVVTSTVTNNPAQPPAPTPTAPTTTVVTTAAQPTKLVNTGPGSVLAIFAVVSVAGAFLHRQLLRKTL